MVEQITQVTPIHRGPRGLSGAGLIHGEGSPAADLGTVGSFYINTLSWTIQKKTGVTTWGTAYSIKGVQGDKGDQGVKGDRGEAFSPTVIGLLAGKTTYDNAQAGFSYLASDTGNIYFKLSNTSADWSSAIPFGKGDQGDPGDPGTNGLTVLNGSGVPAGGTGVNGDFYIDTTAWDIYGPKAAGAWPAGVSLIGPSATDVNTIDGGTTGLDFYELGTPGDGNWTLLGTLYATSGGTGFNTAGPVGSILVSNGDNTYSQQRGIRFTVFDHGTKATGSITPDPKDGPIQKVINGGAFTINEPIYDGGLDLLITNNASAGVITISGFEKALPGDPLTTTNGHKFIMSIRRIDGVGFYQITALQ